jgi:hypothetical protein
VAKFSLKGKNMSVELIERLKRQIERGGKGFKAKVREGLTYCKEIGRYMKSISLA